MPEAKPPPQYCFICSTGRGGTTLTMRVLAAHDQILVRDLHPYETRMRQYAHAAAANGKATVDFTPETHSRVPYQPHQGGDQPSARWCSARRAQATATLADDYYRHIGRLQARETPAWVVEKAIGVQMTIEILQQDEGTRALFLFRDPRDTFFSMKAFNRKAGYEGGFHESQGDEAMFRVIIGTWRRYTKLREEFGRRIRACSYETLVSGPEPWVRVLRWLRLRHDPAYLGEVFARGTQLNADVERHSTAGSVEASVGRWRREAGAADLTLFARFAADITQMGYEL